MGRKPRSIGEIGFCHITARGNNRREVFHTDKDFLAYRGFLQEYRDRWGVEIYHYCLMTNHVHLILKADSPQMLSKFMHGVQRSYFLLRHKLEKRSGHLWETPYGCSPIERENYLLECARYVELNPVEAGMVEKPEDYRWSSYRTYAYGVHDPLVTLSPLFMALGTTSEERKTAYRIFISLGHSEKQNLNRYDVPRYVVPG